MYSDQSALHELLNRRDPSSLGDDLLHGQVGRSLVPVPASIPDERHPLLARQEAQGQRLDGVLHADSKEDKLLRGHLCEEAVGLGVGKQVVGSLPKDNLLVLIEDIDGA
jgi:hypothetical protein